MSDSKEDVAADYEEKKTENIPEWDTVREVLGKYQSLLGRLHVKKKNPDIFPVWRVKYLKERLHAIDYRIDIIISWDIEYGLEEKNKIQHVTGSMSMAQKYRVEKKQGLKPYDCKMNCY